ncbi:MAG TPA: coiled-coil domain-containing protein [Puia sp.]|nr:coiled-coil domain-containing protein [Puia sp.]
METPNIQLYNFLRYDFHLTDIKSLEFMHILDKEYKSSFKDDFAGLEKRMNEGFQTHSKKFDDLKEEFRDLRSDLKVELSGMRSDLKVELGELRSDFKAELSGIRNDFQTGLTGLRSDLRVEIKDSKVETIRWAIALFLALVVMILATYFKK